jgi:hypothetical protein
MGLLERLGRRPSAARVVTPEEQHRAYVEEGKKAYAATVEEAHLLIDQVLNDSLLGSMPEGIRMSRLDRYERATPYLATCQSLARTLRSELSRSTPDSWSINDLVKDLRAMINQFEAVQASANDHVPIVSLDRIGQPPAVIGTLQDQYEYAGHLRDEEVAYAARQPSTSVQAASQQYHAIAEQRQRLAEAKYQLSADMQAIEFAREDWIKLLRRDQDFYQDAAFKHVMQVGSNDPTLSLGAAVEQEVLRLVQQVEQSIVFGAAILLQRLEEQTAAYLAARDELKRLCEEELEDVHPVEE